MLRIYKDYGHLLFTISRIKRREWSNMDDCKTRIIELISQARDDEKLKLIF